MARRAFSHHDDGEGDDKALSSPTINKKEISVEELWRGAPDR